MSRQTPRTDTAADLGLDPGSILLNLVVTFLAPMFLPASGGNLGFARQAALHTVQDYQIEAHADLVTVAQIIAFGLAALGSLSLSMADNLSLSMTLRLRANANACNRSAAQNRQALRGSEPRVMTQAGETALDEAAVLASVAAAQAATLQALPPASPASPIPIDPAPVGAATIGAPMVGTRVNQPAPHPVQPPAAVPPPPLDTTAPRAASAISDSERQSMWAASAARIAAELAAQLPDLPPTERRAATIKAAMLSSCAQNLLNGPPIPRLRPSDVGAMLRL